MNIKTDSDGWINYFGVYIDCHEYIELTEDYLVRK